jgi:hypothetical protein
MNMKREKKDRNYFRLFLGEIWRCEMKLRSVTDGKGNTAKTRY